MATPDEIDAWRALPSEHQGLEFKEAKQSFDFNKLAQYCVAIANEGGGHILLGVADRPPRDVVGSAAFQDIIGTADRLYRALSFRVDLEAVAHPDGRVLIFRVPSRPRGTAYQYDGRYLMRSGSALTAMSEDRLRAIMNEGRPDWLEEFALTDLDGGAVVDLLDTQAYFDLIRRPYPTDREGVLAQLVEGQLIDATGSGYAIRRMGGLLLAKRLDRFPELARKAPRVVVYTGSSKLDVRLDRPGTRGYASGFQGLVEFIMAQLPQNEVVTKALRESIKLLPEQAMRELVANALVHQDFTIGGAAPMFEIYENRVEVSNPGEPIVPVERFIDGWRSRNERLADIMRRMRICEERSSGVDRVVGTVEHYQLPAPDFRVGLGRTIATVYGPQPFEAMGRDDRIRACYQHCALKFVTSEHMTNASLRERFGLPESKAAIASQIISATMDAGFIKPDESVGGSRRFARYLPSWA